MADYGYEYFCGANVIVEVEGMPILECVGIRMSVMESKRPIYGYSSRHYDAVASGQVLVEGALIINYVDHNYLFKAIELGLELNGLLNNIDPPPAVDLSSELRDQLSDEAQSRVLLNEYLTNPEGNLDIAQAIKDKYWDSTVTPPVVSTITPNPHDAYGGVDITVTFGDRELYNFNSGRTSYLVQDVNFLGRGQQIAIDEGVIVEEYPFFARNVLNIQQPYKITFQEEGQSLTDIDQTFMISKKGD